MYYLYLIERQNVSNLLAPENILKDIGVIMPKFEWRRVNWKHIGKFYLLSYGIAFFIFFGTALTGGFEGITNREIVILLLFPAFYPTAMSIWGVINDWLNPCPNHSEDVGTECRTCGRLVEQRGVDLNREVKSK